MLHPVATLSLMFLVECQAVKIKLVGEPFSFQNRDVGQAHIPEVKLVSSVSPAPVNGPQHLHQLLGQCFSLQKASYTYTLCPFQNVTQREQSYRWNAFNGILGVWSKWLIEEGSFSAMQFANGDVCVGTHLRQVKVIFKCGDVNKLVSVEEPITCRYKMVFDSPLVCPKDSLLVYPLLSAIAKDKYKMLHILHFTGVLSSDAYQKAEQSLLIANGILPNEHKSSQISSKTDAVADNKSNEINTAFNTTLEECVKEKKKLLEEITKLEKRLALGKGAANSTRSS